MSLISSVHRRKSRGSGDCVIAPVLSIENTVNKYVYNN